MDHPVHCTLKAFNICLSVPKVFSHNSSPGLSCGSLDSSHGIPSWTGGLCVKQERLRFLGSHSPWDSKLNGVIFKVTLSPTDKNVNRSRLYRVTHLLANLGWVDLDFDCSTVCPILLGLVWIWQKWLSTWARWWNIPNQSQPNPGLLGDGSLCRQFIKYTGLLWWSRTWVWLTWILMFHLLPDSAWANGSLAELAG